MPMKTDFSDAGEGSSEEEDVFAVVQRGLKSNYKKELMADVDSHKEQFQSLTSTAQNLLVGMKSKECDSLQFTSQLSELQSSWSDLQSILNTFHTRLQKECQDLNCYLERLGDFSERLNAVYTEFYDELCTAIPPNASQETINKQKQVLEMFNNKILAMSEEFQLLKKDGERWGSKAIPEKWMDEFRELSPGVDDSGGDSTNLSVDKQLTTSENRLRRMNQMLKERALDLELTQGDAATLMKSATELLDWVETNFNLEFLHERPPGELDGLLNNSQGIKAIKESFEERRRTLQRLHDFASSSKGTLSEANLKKIEFLMAKLDCAWEKMEATLTSTEISTENVLSKVEAFNTRYNQYKEWQEQAEQSLQKCLPIEADLDRLEEQQEILQSLNNEILEHKRIPEELGLQADAILVLSKEGTGEELLKNATSMQEKFTQLEEEGAESVELCEEAKSDVQVYNGLEIECIQLMDKLEESFDVLKNKPKRPMGNIQETVDEHLDYCIDVESKACVYNKMYECGRKICKKYPPSKNFTDKLSDMTEKWEKFVDSILSRWAHYAHLKDLWHEFEKIVKDFLEWLMAEGKSFSKDVTTLGGEKGVSDHMKTCETFKNSLKNKGTLLDEITLKADVLQEEDDEKPNGTRDIDSRLNDVSIHWNSVCQLLSETLVTLVAVYKKLTLINEITMNEQDWLNEMAIVMANKRTTHGVIDIVKEEIELFNNNLQQFEDHRPAFVVILETEDFMLEHSSCLEHDVIKKIVKELVQKFETMNESGRDYVGKLEKSIPLWEMFIKQKDKLSQWVVESQQTYNNGMRLGNATITRKSLENAEFLYEDIQSHLENVEILNDLMKELSSLCVSGDQDFMADRTNAITDTVELLKENTVNQKDLLESRMESWKVFPVEAAVEVQDFLDAVSKEVEEDEDFDECSAEELLLKLERLEHLQFEQNRKRSSVVTLDSSASNEEVQRALAKNPDISEERTSLLQGWSSRSSQLSSKLQLLRLKADMTLAIEKRTKGCANVLELYRKHLSISLPHSVALHKLQSQWQDTEKELGEDCIEAVNDLTDTYNDYENDPRVQVPKRLSDAVNDIKSKHVKLKVTATELTDHIAQRVHDWESFDQTMESLLDWLNGTRAELNDICRYYMFLSFFQDALDRHRLVQNQMKTKLKDYQHLQQNYQRHLAVERKVSIIPLQLSINNSESMEESLEQDGRLSPTDDKECEMVDGAGQSIEEQGDQQDTMDRPGQSQGDQQDIVDRPGQLQGDQQDTSVTVERVGQSQGDVSDMVGQSIEGQRDQMDIEGSEHDADLVRYQSQWTAIEENWTIVNTKLEEFLIDKEPWEKMADQYLILDEWRDEMKERIERSIRRGEEIYRLDKNPGPLTETYTQFQIEINTTNQSVTGLQSSIDHHLTQHLRTMHLSVREFITCCELLKDDLVLLNNRTDELARTAIQKMEVWERRASECMRRVPLLENEIDNKMAEIVDLEQQIGHLQREPPRQPRTACTRRLFKLLLSIIPCVLIILSLCSILIFCNLDDSTRYHILYRLQYLPFFELSSDDSSPTLIF